jgi:hypothetical protein
MIEVAIVSLQRALIADGREIPEGSAQFASRPMESDLGGPEDDATGSPGPKP